MEGAAKKSVAIDEKKNQYHGATDELVWVSHPEEIWVKGKIVSEDGDMFTVHLQSTPGMKGEGRQKVSKKDIYIVNRSSAEDMTSLHHLHEPGKFKLKNRYFLLTPWQESSRIWVSGM